MRLFIEQLWSATREGKPLTRCALFFWWVLKFLSYLYAFGFSVRQQFWRRISPPQAPCNIPVIAVGNLSMGGTGKSVFVDWLIRHLVNFKHPVVLLRGYCSPLLRKQDVFVVSDEKTIFGDAAVVGDEAAQVAKRGVAVAIGKNRYKALMALLGVTRPDIVILDDGYQTTTIHKDCTILLIDARAPFENEWLFPAGPLREKDYNRADIIVLTHADQANHPLSYLKQKYFPDILPEKITAGRHAFEAFVNSEGDIVNVSAGTGVVLCSGIAKPQNLEETVRQQGLVTTRHFVFFDHHDYTSDDVQTIITACKQHNPMILITTEKDWTKLQAFQSLFAEAKVTCLVAKITFEFLTPHEYAVFATLLRNVLQKVALQHKKTRIAIACSVFGLSYHTLVANFLNVLCF